MIVVRWQCQHLLFWTKVSTFVTMHDDDVDDADDLRFHARVVLRSIACLLAGMHVCKLAKVVMWTPCGLEHVLC